MPELVPFPVDRADITPYYEALTAALDGKGPALAPYEAGAARPELPSVDDAPADLALVVSTSGSTGTPKRAMLTRSALIASALATHERISAGTWLLPLPPHHIAGTQVIVRSIVAGTTPTVLAAWSLTDFTKATTLVARNAPPFSAIHTSLVPAQLRDLLDGDDPHAQALNAARRFRSILVGGSATPASLRERAQSAGLNIVTTYGSSETAGGCVYDGRPLEGVGVRVIDPDDDGVGRIALTGPTLASGYLGDAERTDAAFATLDDGTPAYLTDDLGSFDGTLTVTGRADDVINTGGYKVAPRVVEDAVLRVAQVHDVVAVARPHERWGETVAVAIVTEPGIEDDPDATSQLLERLLEECRKSLPAYAIPTLVRFEPTLPLTGVGKPDRAFVARATKWQNLR